MANKTYRYKKDSQILPKLHGQLAGATVSQFKNDTFVHITFDESRKNELDRILLDSGLVFIAEATGVLDAFVVRDASDNPMFSIDNNGNVSISGVYQTSLGPLAINDLGDVDTAGLSPSDHLAWNGTNWIPYAVANLTETELNSKLINGSGINFATTSTTFVDVVGMSGCIIPNSNTNVYSSCMFDVETTAGGGAEIELRLRINNQSNVSVPLHRDLKTANDIGIGSVQDMHGPFPSGVPVIVYLQARSVTGGNVIVDDAILFIQAQEGAVGAIGPAGADGSGVANVNGTSIFLWGNEKISDSTTTRYATPGYSHALAQSNVVSLVCPVSSGVFGNLIVYHNEPKGNGNDIVYTLNVNGSPTSLSVAVPSTATSGSNLIDSVDVFLSDTIEMVITKAVKTDNGGPKTVMITAELTTTAGERGPTGLPGPVGASGSVEMNDLTDADTATTSPTLEDSLVWNGSNWIPSGIAPGVVSVSMDDLTDADTTTSAPSLEDSLVWNGSNWAPSGLSPGVSAHVDTTGKQGGTTNEFYHLTAAEHGLVQKHKAFIALAGATPVLADLTTLAADGDWALSSGVTLRSFMVARLGTKKFSVELGEVT